MKAAGIALFGLFFLPGSFSAAQSPLSVSLKPAAVHQGGIVEIRASGEGLQTVRGFVRGREISFFAEQELFTALAGMDLEEKTGTVEVRLEAWSKSGEKIDKRAKLRVREKRFPQEKISVPAAFDHIDEATRRRIQIEQEQLDRLWAFSTPRRWWETPFVAPVAGGVTSPFGLRRIVNGVARSPHGGVDLKASLGTEIFAANHGQVVLREELFFSGKSLVLDHGGGLYSMYFHLNDFNVAKDGQVRRGDLIGWAGMTGRATGPHLHWGVRLNGARVDPHDLVAMK